MTIQLINQTMRPRNGLLLNVLTNYVAKIATLATGFVMTPFMLHRLGADQFGLWVLVASVVAYGGLLDFGLSSAVVKYVARYRADRTYSAER